MAGPDSDTPGNELTEKEASWRIRDRWLFDSDDDPSLTALIRGIEYLWMNSIRSTCALITNHPLLTALLRYLKGVSLYWEDDHQRLTTDSTVYTPSSDGRLFGFLLYQVGIAPVFRDDAVIIGPCLHPPQAMAAPQHSNG